MVAQQTLSNAAERARLATFPIPLVSQLACLREGGSK